MHLPLIIAFGAQLALGHFSNSSDSWPQSDDAAAAAAAQPWVVGDFRFFGCAASTAGFPLFKQVAFTDFMNLDFCAASCPGRYFGTSDKDCYCGDELDTETADKVDSDRCDTPCPGDGSQICGGHSTSDWDKQSSSSVVTLSLYIRLGEEHYQQRDHEDEDTCEEEGDRHGGWQFTRPPPHQTYTSTITSTTTSTITSCAPDVPHCPLGDRVVQAVTVTTELCPPPEWSRKKITCYGDHCAPDEPCREGDDDEQCQRQRVVCNGESCHPEPCSDKDDWHKLVVCDDDKSDCQYRQCAGEECGTKIVCYDGQCAKQKCWGDECRTKFVCKGPECRHEACEDGEDCHAHHVCSESGDDCQAQPPCSGPECPVPPPPVSKPESPAFKPWYPAASELESPASPASKPEPPASKPESPAPTQHRPGHETAYPQPAAPTNGHGLPHPTGVPVVAGSTQLGATLFGVLLSFVLFL
ncbi:hypothetical protein A9Z42_0091690 [Trichoderma parareesei]|uniref:WSC domain-containing protein n=1 Tax=Trichoderma parareesei TaxID=858221 RepID=A0A2H3A2F0_TRIPA|nr:hypothetical protein A9Z42_0091690 [Trichoderma parareesei]